MTETLTDIIRQRRTIHDFVPAPVPDKQCIIDAINIARWAPNHHLTEPWHFYLPGEETKQKIIRLNTELVRRDKGDAAAEKKQQRWSAMPGWLVISCDRSDDELLQQEDYAACCCMVQNLMLVLWAQNIGMKWSTGPVIRNREFHDLLWIDSTAETVVGLFWYGHPDVIPVTVRKPVEQLLVELP